MATRGLVLLAKDTFSNVTSVSFDNVFSNTYKQYKLITVASSSGPNNIRLRLRAGGSDNSSANYARQYLVGTSTSVVAGRETSQTSWNGVGRVENGIEMVSICEILNPFQTAYTSASNLLILNPTGSIEVLGLAYGITVTTSYDGFSLAPSDFSGTLFSGTVTLYGLAE